MPETDDWYVNAKPPWAPAPWLFGVAWAALYLLLGYLWTAAAVSDGAFAVHLVLNLLWTPVFFYDRTLGFGVLLATLATAVNLYLVHRSHLWVPYIAWLAYAAALNYAFIAG